MCIAAFALDVGPYAAVIISNRDEWLHRPAQAMAWWPETEMLAGKDLTAGGTWLGLTKSGRFALITNIRGSSLDEKQYPNSRGKLPLLWLSGKQNLAEFSDFLNYSASDFAGYNIVYGCLSTRQLQHFNNQERVVNTLVRGQIHGLSNASLDTPWPKLVSLKRALENILSSEISTTDDSKHLLLNALNDKTSFDDSPLSAINVEVADFHGTGNTYGRRCSTVILIEHSGAVHVEENQRDGNSNGFEWQSCFKCINS
jgi:uncharacterized protein with NRDE domain